MGAHLRALTPPPSCSHRVCGLITSSDLLRKELNNSAVFDVEGRLLVGAAVGVKDGSPSSPPPPPSSSSFCHHIMRCAGSDGPHALPFVPSLSALPPLPPFHRFVERAAALVEAGCDVLVIDIAHGHSQLAVSATQELKKNFPKVDVIAGNVATGDGVRALVDAGADGIKVGVVRP